MVVEYPPDIPPERRSATPEEIAAVRRALIAKRLAVVLGVVAFVAVMAVGSVSAILVRNSQTGNRAVLDRVEECTTPGQPCYERGQKQLADTVAGLNRYGVIVAACASGPVERSVEEITACVVAELRSQDEHKSR